jgi:GPH family glycoside/pentoside/hexuronide:cation symporter
LAVAEGVAGPAVADASGGATASKAPIVVKLAYCFGQVVESSYLGIAGFVFFYYTAVLGLSGSLVGASLALAMCLDAVADPLIGSWSDSIRSRLGRRLPAMLIGAPLTFVTMGLLFSPPSGLTPLLMFLWLTLNKMGVRAFASMFNIPFFALGGEMSDDYVERTRIVAWRLLAGIVTGVAQTALAFSVFFTGKVGLQRAEAYPAFGWTVAGVVLVCALICCAGVARYAAALPQPTTQTKGMLARLPAELAEVFRNRSFLILFLSMFIFATSAGVAQALNNHAYVFLWRVPAEKLQILAYVFLLGILVGTPTTPIVLKWLEKKTACMLGFLLVTAAFVILPALRAAGLFAPTGDAALPWLTAMTFFIGIGTGVVFIAFPAMMADAADEHEYLYGSRREGLFFSGLGFGGKAAAGMGALVGGLALDWLHFPREAGRQVGAVLDETVLRHLAASWGLLPALLLLGAAAIFWPYGISRTRQAEIAAALKLKRAADVREGRSS